ncbi:hypothetical protein EDC01DRAFT_789466 [Geopyxis carbonaria]|nr:hypothetical protein EDC01DRAFT_789466 [Geopyxis carbonaria]
MMHHYYLPAAVMFFTFPSFAKSIGDRAGIYAAQTIATTVADASASLAATVTMLVSCLYWLSFVWIVTLVVVVPVLLLRRGAGGARVGVSGVERRYVDKGLQTEDVARGRVEAVGREAAREGIGAEIEGGKMWRG